MLWKNILFNTLSILRIKEEGVLKWSGLGRLQKRVVTRTVFKVSVGCGLAKTRYNQAEVKK